MKNKLAERHTNCRPSWHSSGHCNNAPFEMTQNLLRGFLCTVELPIKDTIEKNVLFA